jgi:nitroreductase
MQLQNAITKRRSCRKFKNKKPNWRDILDCLNITRYTPMAGGYFTLNFLIIDKKEDIQKVAKWAEQDFIKDAPYLILFISDPSITKNIYGERGTMYHHQQAGAAIQNFMLSITEKKLYTCWIGHFNEEKIKKLFKISNSQKIEAILPIGYEKEKPKTRSILAELYNRTHFHIWGNRRIKKPKIIEHYAPEGYL